MSPCGSGQFLRRTCIRVERISLPVLSDNFNVIRKHVSCVSGWPGQLPGSAGTRSKGSLLLPGRFRATPKHASKHVAAIFATPQVLSNHVVASFPWSQTNSGQHPGNFWAASRMSMFHRPSKGKQRCWNRRGAWQSWRGQVPNTSRMWLPFGMLCVGKSLHAVWSAPRARFRVPVMDSNARCGVIRGNPVQTASMLNRRSLRPLRVSRICAAIFQNMLFQTQVHFQNSSSMGQGFA